MSDITVGNGKEEPKNATQEKTLIYQIMQKQLEELKERITVLERSFIEIESSKQAITDLEKVNTERDILVPLGSGCYTKGCTKKNSILTDVGAGVFVWRTFKQALDSLETKKKDVETAHTSMQVNMQEIVNQMNSIAMELQGNQ